MRVSKLIARKVLNSRAQETVEVRAYSGKFEGKGTAMSGASAGKFEVPAFGKSISSTIRALNKTFVKWSFEFSKFQDLEKIYLFQSLFLKILQLLL